MKANVFRIRFKDMEAVMAGLYEPGARPVDELRVGQWRSTWANACEGVFEVSKAELLQYGMLLGRVAEACSQYPVAEDVFNRLVESAARGEEWIPDPASVLITSGEFSRRRGNLDNAESRYNQALAVLEQDARTSTGRRKIHSTLGRLFYELAYLHRLRGDAGAARATLERSAVESELGDDRVGAQIANTILAVICYEEGSAAAAIRTLEKCLAALESLRDDPQVAEAKRSGFAKRWVFNARIHLAQARLGAGDCAGAREVFQSAQAEISLGSCKRVEAQLLLAEGNWAAAREAIGASRSALEQEAGGLKFTELSAGTVSFAGLLYALRDSDEARQSALSNFEEACALPPDLHNRRAQGCAWAGRAILAGEAGDAATRLQAIHNGLAAVQRCGAPTRAFLLDLLRSQHSSGQRPGIPDLKELVCRGC